MKAKEKEINRLFAGFTCGITGPEFEAVVRDFDIEENNLGFKTLTDQNGNQYQALCIRFVRGERYAEAQLDKDLLDAYSDTGPTDLDSFISWECLSNVEALVRATENV